MLLLLFKRVLFPAGVPFSARLRWPGIIVVFLLSESGHLFAKSCSLLLYKAFFLCVSERFELLLLLLLPLRFWLPKAS